MSTPDLVPAQPMVIIRDFLPVCKVAGAWSGPFTSI